MAGTIILGGMEFVDLRRPNEAWGPIGEVDLIVVHHSVSDFDIRADNDLDSIMAILRYHEETLAWPGNGYHINVGDDGAKYLVGDLGQQRAHIKYKNHRAWGICLLGDYTHVEPPPAQVQGCAEAIVALRRHAGKPNMRWAGHYDVADPRSPTACPGDQWPNYKDDLERVVAEEMIKPISPDREFKASQIGLIRAGKYQEQVNAMAACRGVRATV